MFRGRKKENGQSPEIKHAGPLFDRYKKLLRAPQGSVVKVFCEVVKDEYGFEIQKERVDYNPHTKIIYLKMSGPIKHELLLGKKKLLAGCEERLGGSSSPKAIV